MKKSLLKNLHKLFALIAIFFMISSSLGQIHILAEGECTGDYLRCRAVPLDMSKVTATRDFSQVQTKDVTVPTTETTLVNGGTYSITYLSAIDYYGQKLSLKIDVAIPQNGIKNVGGEHYTDNTIGLTNEKRLGLFLNATASAGGDAYGDGQEGFGANSTQATVSYTFLDATGQVETPFTGLIGIEDIDGSDYLFSTTNRTVYYVDGENDDAIAEHHIEGAMAADHFIVDPNGVYRDRTPADRDTVGSYNNAMLFIPLNNESTFTFGFSSRSDAIGLPLIYTWKYTIKYNKNADDATGSMGDNVYDNSYSTMPSKDKWSFERSGYQFKGFKVENADPLIGKNDAGNYSYDYKNALLAETDRTIELFAQWEPIYTIKYNKNAEDAVNTMNDNNYTSEAATMPSDEEWLFERPGYEFIGFKVENEDPLIKKNADDNYSYDYKNALLADPDRTIELYAQWNALPYKLKYNANGGSGDMPDSDFLGSDLTMDSASDWTFTREGYNLVGYKIENEGNTFDLDPRNFKSDLLADDDRIITLYAQWEPIKYNVLFDPNEPMPGSVKEKMTNHLNILYDTTYNLNKNVYTAEGYSWVGWNMKPDRSGTPFTDEQAFKNLTNIDGGTVTLYAQWEPWKYTIRYDANGGTGDMPDQVFTYFDPSMVSKENAFDAGGFRFIGFDYYDKAGNKYRITNPSELRQVLIDLGPNSVLTLVAQWEKIEYPAAPYRLPMTGIK